MKEYNKRDDWKIIQTVKQELNKRWVDVGKLKIDCTRGVLQIQGELDFTGQGKSAMDSVTSIAVALRKYDAALKGLSNVRDVKWHLLGWEKHGRLWSYRPTAAIRKRDESRGFKTQ
ncbi:MAG: hypothetical protein GF384_03540 [Elusimicrobia bacterium]|nr:hypothetical protein [Elusimicrobiota bacterium]MBD3411987.1 hypothetical protein [Elusimicrobiota bacterium]